MHTQRIPFWFLVFALAGSLSAQPEPSLPAPSDFAQRFSAGLSFGMLSGFAGVSGRYWGDTWGVQASALPAQNCEIGDGCEGIWMGGLQLMRPFHPISPGRGHEQGGYVQSFAYPFLATSVLHASRFTTGTLGAGFGLETRWRNWRLATGVGVVGMYMDDRDYTPSDEIYLLPSFDISILVGI